jgi:Ca-activated chloride channel family protein
MPWTALSVPQGTFPFAQGGPTDAQLQITQIDRSAFPEIRVYISATDASGEPAAVSADDLRLFENGQPVEPKSILGAGEVGPLTTMLVIDISGSMDVAGKLDAAKSAALAYIDQMEPGDRAGLIAFDVESTVVQTVTEDRQSLAEAIHSLKTGGDTAMFDALIEGIRQLEPVPGRKAIIVLTDGMDNSSTATLEDTLARTGGGGLSISAIGLGDRSELGASFAGLNEERLEALAQRAGGVYTRTADAAELRQTYQRLGRVLHSEYVVTYVTTLPLRDGVNRTLDVRLASTAAAASGRYNPGGVVPEVAQAASWSLFGLALAVLAALLVLPALIRLGRGAARHVPLPRRAEPQPAARVRLREAATPTERNRIRLHEAGTAAAGEDHAHHP